MEGNHLLVQGKLSLECHRNMQQKKLFPGIAILLICGPSSSGKSSLANMICEIDGSFVKINTKEINVKTEIDFTKKYFLNELHEASKITGKSLEKINDIFIESKKMKNDYLLQLTRSLALKLERIDKKIYFDILYFNYKQVVVSLLSKNKRCIIDHNIFLDSTGLRKEIFFKKFLSFKNSLKIISIYTYLERILLNNIKRNERFYDFISSTSDDKNKYEIVSNFDKKSGFSNIIFRQPLRILENYFNLYRVTSKPSKNYLQKIDKSTFKKIFKISDFEQRKLIGFLISNNYLFSHIPNSELINLSKEYAYLNTVNGTIYISSEKSDINLQLLIDRKFVKKDVEILSNFKGDTLEFKDRDNAFFLSEKINCLLKAIENPKYKNLEEKYNQYNNKFVVDDFKKIYHDDCLNRLINKLLKYKEIFVIYPINHCFNSVIYLSVNKQELKLIYNNINKHSFGNNDFDLVFLGTLFAFIKSNEKLCNFQFIFKNCDFATI